MKIINIVTQMEGGGAQAAAMRLARGLGDRGFYTETWFLYLRRPTYLGRTGVRVLLDHPPRHAGDYGVIFIRLIRQLKRVSPDGVITFTHYANILGQLAAWISGIKCRVASQRNPSWSYPRAARWVDRLLGTLGVYKENIMVSEAVNSSFKGYPAGYRRNNCVVYNGIQFHPSLLGQTQSRTYLSLPQKCLLVVTIGRLAAQKNQALLIRSMAQLPGVHLAIAGEGELRHGLEKKAEDFGVGDRVHFLGEIIPGDVKELLNAADIFAMPSRFEGLSNAMLEAIGAGVPVIASDIPSQAEVLGLGGIGSCGILLPPDEVRAWVEAIQRLCHDKRLRQKLRQRARERSADFTMEKMISGFELAIMRAKK